MKRSHTIKIEDLQNSIQDISKEQATKIYGGSPEYPLPLSEVSNYPLPRSKTVCNSPGLVSSEYPLP